MTIIPGIGALGSFSPLVNEESTSIKGIGMIEKLGNIYQNFNLFFKDPMKKDLLRRPYVDKVSTIIAANIAAVSGDHETIERLQNRGLDLNLGDYDGRVPLHLASSAGYLETVKFLVCNGA